METARIGPHSRPHRLLRLDGRTREAKIMAATRAELTVHIGGNPSSVQRTLIERAARLGLYLEMLDAKGLAAGGLTERDSRQYIAWSNGLRLVLRELGITAASAERPNPLAAHFAKPPSRETRA
jgi:hypothetical protein